jgi:hypothetical protein
MCDEVFPRIRDSDSTCAGEHEVFCAESVKIFHHRAIRGRRIKRTRPGFDTGVQFDRKWIIAETPSIRIATRSQGSNCARVGNAEAVDRVSCHAIQSFRSTLG